MEPEESKDEADSLTKLSDGWTFWYVYQKSHQEKRRMKGKARWSKEYNLTKIFTFDTAEEFWQCWNNLYSVTDIISSTDYLLFKAHMKPEWEDPENVQGGKWVVTIPTEDDFEEESA